MLFWPCDNHAVTSAAVCSILVGPEHIRHVVASPRSNSVRVVVECSCDCRVLLYGLEEHFWLAYPVLKDYFDIRLVRADSVKLVFDVRVRKSFARATVLCLLRGSVDLATSINVSDLIASSLLSGLSLVVKTSQHEPPWAFTCLELTSAKQVEDVLSLDYVAESPEYTLYLRRRKLVDAVLGREETTIEYIEVELVRSISPRRNILPLDALDFSFAEVRRFTPPTLLHNVSQIIHLLEQRLDTVYAVLPRGSGRTALLLKVATELWPRRAPLYIRLHGDGKVTTWHGLETVKSSCPTLSHIVEQYLAASRLDDIAELCARYSKHVVLLVDDLDCAPGILPKILKLPCQKVVVTASENLCRSGHVVVLRDRLTASDVRYALRWCGVRDVDLVNDVALEQLAAACGYRAKKLAEVLAMTRVKTVDAVLRTAIAMKR